MKQPSQPHPNGTARAHETLEGKLRDLMAQDEKARTERDKLVSKLATVDEAIAIIAADKLALMGELNGLYKKAAAPRLTKAHG